MLHKLRRTAIVVASAGLALMARAQTSEFRLDEKAGFTPTRQVTPGTDEAVIQEARAALAAGDAKKAMQILDPWLEEYETSDNPYLAQAYLVRGDAKVADDDEYEALYDYEAVVKNYSATPEFVTCLEREFEIAKRYVNGFNRKWWLGWRIEDASTLGEEMLVRINERLPGSKLAEKAMLELCDFYYRERELKLAAESYDIFLINFPNSPDRSKAMQRRVYSNIARFKGPKYDASGLIEAKELINQYSGKYPLEAEQAGLSDALMARLDESSAAAMLDSAQWYLRRNDAPSARLTLRRLIAKHPGTIASGKAADILEAKGWLVSKPAPEVEPDSKPEPKAVPKPDPAAAPAPKQEPGK